MTCVERTEIRLAVERSLRTAKEELVLGFIGLGLTMAEIGSIIGVKKERVYQIRVRALARRKRRMACEKE